MNCEQARPLIESYADGEMDAAGNLELERHFQTCPACALAWRNLQSMKQAIKQDALFFTAPQELRRKIKAELYAQTGGQPERKFWDWNWLAAATTAVAAICLALLLTVTLTRPSAQQQFAQEVVSSHVRSLMADHALDVTSSDQHTVKPWFDGKLDFSPTVRDLGPQGFPLVGGRLDYLGGHAVAALVYQRHKHVINLFVWPTKNGDSPPGVITTIQGYHLVRWIEAGMTYWAVSDLNENELLEFSRDWNAATSPSR